MIDGGGAGAQNSTLRSETIDAGENAPNSSPSALEAQPRHGGATKGFSRHGARSQHACRTKNMNMNDEVLPGQYGGVRDGCSSRPNRPYRPAKVPVHDVFQMQGQLALRSNHSAA